MTTNIGNADRLLRIVVGALLIAWALGFLPGLGANAWGWIGLIPLATAMVGFAFAIPVIGHASWHAYRETVDASGVSPRID